MNATVNELARYAELENTEWGESCLALIQLRQKSYALSTELVTAIDKEIAEQLELFKEETHIVEKTETRVVKYEVLEWT